MIPRRHFLGTLGATLAGAGAMRAAGKDKAAPDKLQLGMMFQSGSAAKLLE